VNAWAVSLLRTRGRKRCGNWAFLDLANSHFVSASIEGYLGSFKGTIKNKERKGKRKKKKEKREKGKEKRRGKGRKEGVGMDISPGPKLLYPLLHNIIQRSSPRSP